MKKKIIQNVGIYLRKTFSNVRKIDFLEFRFEFHTCRKNVFRDWQAKYPNEDKEKKYEEGYTKVFRDWQAKYPNEDKEKKYEEGYTKVFSDWQAKYPNEDKEKKYEEGYTKVFRDWQAKYPNEDKEKKYEDCLLYTSPSPRDRG